MKKQYKVGDEVTSHLLLLSGHKKIKVKGKIKNIFQVMTRTSYIITGGVVEDYPTRIIK